MTEKQITITKSSIKAPTNQYDMRRATDDAFTCFFLFYHPSPPLSFKRIHNMTTSLILEFFFSGVFGSTVYGVDTQIAGNSAPGDSRGLNFLFLASET